MSTPTPNETASAAVDAHGMLAADVYCRKCGYNLRGLRPESNCPECGGPIADSLRADMLRFADPAYVRRLAQGNRWVVRGLTWVVLGYLGSIIALIPGIAFTSVSPAVATLTSIGFALSTLTWVGGILLALAGLWKFTSADPGGCQTRARDIARRLVRLYLVIGLLGWAFEYAVEKLMPPMIVMALVVLASIGLSVFGVVGVVAYFRYTRGLARRIPDLVLVGRATGLARELGVVLGVLVFFGAVDSVVRWAPALLGSSAPAVIPSAMPSPAASTPGFPLGPWYMMKSCVTAVAHLAVLICFFRVVRLQTSLRGPLAEQAALAEGNRQAALTPAAE